VDDVSSKQAEDIAFRGELARWRLPAVRRAASMTNRQANAFCVKLWQHTQTKLGQLHFRVQSCLEHLNHFSARRF
jgi:hypothetical protein